MIDSLLWGIPDPHDNFKHDESSCWGAFVNLVQAVTYPRINFHPIDTCLTFFK